jgi:deoxycytidine triphosphate deaminase
MSIFSDVDIRKALGKDIVIEPFTESSLTPIGYDFTVGEYIYSLEHGLIEPQNGEFEIPANSTIQILTRESLWVSGRIGGTFHSKVSLVSRGMSHISTTLDPGWYGPLLITLRNNMATPQRLKTTDAFVTLIFFKVNSPTTTKHNKPESRRDILVSQLNNQTERYINKIQQVLGDPKIRESFEHQVQQANKPMLKKVIASARSVELGQIGAVVLRGMLVVLLVAVGTLGLYWEKVRFIFGDINYDSQIIGNQLGVFVSIVAVLISLRRS